ncbi:unnamed protein product [Protopolystoma xenopodis]|uniref:Uncharacterized protein n=1 Tax=Protopolystoma xenopodis TaxID=117903 RepID=A0A3S5BZD2_9PLAT|nr:unnamed protein product [Protopolystoma xenopodis]
MYGTHPTCAGCVIHNRYREKSIEMGLIGHCRGEGRCAIDTRRGQTATQSKRAKLYPKEGSQRIELKAASLRVVKRERRACGLPGLQGPRPREPQTDTGGRGGPKKGRRYVKQ